MTHEEYKKRPKHRTLKERLAGFEGDYIAQEWDTGPSVGREILPPENSTLNSMKKRTSKDIRTHYADVIRDMKENGPIIITRNGQSEAVLIDVKDYPAYEEFLHIRYVKEKLAEMSSEEGTQRKTIQELFEGYEGTEEPREVDWGEPVGKEVW